MAGKESDKRGSCRICKLRVPVYFIFAGSGGSGPYYRAHVHKAVGRQKSKGPVRCKGSAGKADDVR